MVKETPRVGCGLLALSALLTLSACDAGAVSGEPEVDRDASLEDAGGPPGDDAGMTAEDGSRPLVDGGTATPGGGMGDWPAQAGLLWPDGIEPGAPGDCEAVSPNRCWWVDADAPSGGDGSFASPFNSFEVVAGYYDTVANGYRTGLLTGGDHLYLTGTFRPSAETGSEFLRLHLWRGTQGGTAEAPTVIKSYKGTPRAVFDGEHLIGDLISVRGGADAFGGLLLQNLEIRRGHSKSVEVSGKVEHFEAVSLYVHDTKSSNGPSASDGGMTVYMGSTLHHYEVHHCVFENNNLEGNGREGGLSLISESTADPDSRLLIHDNLFRGESSAIRHKHSGTVWSESFQNVISGGDTAFYIRATHNLIYDNLIVDVATVFNMWDENRQGNSEAWMHHNTIVNTGRLLRVLSDNAADSYTRFVHVTDNIISVENPCGGECGFIELGRWASNYGVAVEGWTFATNLYRFGTEPAAFLFHKEIGSDGVIGPLPLEAGLSHLGDDSSFRADPLFVDPDGGNYRLAEDSPARGVGTDDSTLGAFR